MDVKKFRADMYELGNRACKDDNEATLAKVLATADILIGLYKKNLVKINHSVLELVCAHSLIKDGYEVKVEQRLDKQLVCDVYGKRGDGALIVEIETGFIPPEAALRPATYAQSRIASKLARYSRFAGKFALGTTSSYVLDFSPFFVKPPRFRSLDEAAAIKRLTDMYYDKPAISLQELLYARIHSVFVIDVDNASTREVDPETYLQSVASLDRQEAGVHSGDEGRVERG
ncbi:MAG: hypothetical protein LYZ69_05770 [Nitrososphaerales archaeon]|nr:hypothetical protein [Nitrososphaerales archaeon]